MRRRPAVRLDGIHFAAQLGCWTATGHGMKAEILEREFRSRSAAPSETLLLLAGADALALIDRAAEEGVPIVGIHGFRVGGGEAEPDRDQIADYSAAVAEGHGCWEDAETFIRARSDTDLVFELTLGDDPVEVV